MEQVEKLTSLALDYAQFSAGDLSDAVKMMHAALPKRVTFKTTKDELIAEKVDDAQQIKTRKRWTSDEQQRFEEGCKLFGTDYNKVSQYVGTRSVLAITSRFWL